MLLEESPALMPADRNYSLSLLLLAGLDRLNSTAYSGWLCIPFRLNPRLTNSSGYWEKFFANRGYLPHGLKSNEMFWTLKAILPDNLSNLFLISLIELEMLALGRLNLLFWTRLSIPLLDWICCILWILNKPSRFSMFLLIMVVSYSLTYFALRGD